MIVKLMVMVVTTVHSVDFSVIDLAVLDITSVQPDRPINKYFSYYIFNNEMFPLMPVFRIICLSLFDR